MRQQRSAELGVVVEIKPRRIGQAERGGRAGVRVQARADAELLLDLLLDLVGQVLVIVQEIARAVREGPGREREVHLVLENNANQAHYMERNADGSPRTATAQWDDDVHHSLHVLTSGETDGYYADFAARPLQKLGRALAEGFAYQGEYSGFRDKARGEPSGHLPPSAFVGFLQNHDMIGNRAFGERIDAIAAPEAVRAIAAVYLLLPQIPMLFMGEEWGAPQPFPFFCDFTGQLAEAIRTGRRREFARFPQFRDEAARARIPDPQAVETFVSAKLDWDNPQAPPYAERLEWYRRVIGVRRREIVPVLASWAGRSARVNALGRNAVVVRWATGGEDDALTLAANLAPVPHRGFPPATGRVLWQEGTCGDDGTFGPWAVRWTLC